MSKNIINYNRKGQLHSYNEWYWDVDNLRFKGFYNNDTRIDYQEYYYYTGELQKWFYI